MEDEKDLQDFKTKRDALSVAGDKLKQAQDDYAIKLKQFNDAKIKLNENEGE